MPHRREAHSISPFSYEETKMTKSELKARKALSGREFKRTLSNTPKAKRIAARAWVIG